MPVTVLYPEVRQQPDNLETEVFGPDLRIVKRDTGALAELSSEMKPGWQHILIELLHREHPVGRVHAGCAGIGGGVGRNGAERLNATGR